MLSLFNGSRKIFFFPVRWANSVTNWCLGLNSPSGTIKVRNTANPSESGAEIDVDVEVLKSRLADALARVFVAARSFFDYLVSRIDGVSIVHEEGTIRVSEEWVKNMAGSSGANVSNLVVYQIYKPTGTSHYYAVPYTLTFANGLLTGCMAGTAFDIYLAQPNANVPLIS